MCLASLQPGKFRDVVPYASAMPAASGHVIILTFFRIEHSKLHIIFVWWDLEWVNACKLFEHLRNNVISWYVVEFFQQITLNRRIYILFSSVNPFFPIFFRTAKCVPRRQQGVQVLPAHYVVQVALIYSLFLVVMQNEFIFL